MATGPGVWGVPTCLTRSCLLKCSDWVWIAHPTHWWVLGPSWSRQVSLLWPLTVSAHRHSPVNKPELVYRAVSLCSLCICSASFLSRTLPWCFGECLLVFRIPWIIFILFFICVFVCCVCNFESGSWLHSSIWLSQDSPDWSFWTLWWPPSVCCRTLLWDLSIYSFSVDCYKTV